MRCDAMRVQEQEQVPLGWEERTTGYGRRYYVSHETRTTQVLGTPEPKNVLSGGVRYSKRFVRRYDLYSIVQYLYPFETGVDTCSAACAAQQQATDALSSVDTITCRAAQAGAFNEAVFDLAVGERVTPPPPSRCTFCHGSSRNHGRLCLETTNCQKQKWRR